MTRPEVLAQRLRHSPNVRPLVAGRDPIAATLRRLAAARERFYAAATRVSGVAEPVSVLVDRSRRRSSRRRHGPDAAGAVPRGDDEDRATSSSEKASPRAPSARRSSGLDARRAIVVSEPGAWAAVVTGSSRRRSDAGWRGRRGRPAAGRGSEAADGDRERRAVSLPRLRVERGEPLVVVGGGALGDAPASWPRSICAGAR